MNSFIILLRRMNLIIYLIIIVTRRRWGPCDGRAEIGVAKFCTHFAVVDAVFPQMTPFFLQIRNVSWSSFTYKLLLF